MARLAKRHGVRVKELASANGLKPTSKLKAGASLVLPESVGAAESRTAQARGPKASGGTKSTASAGTARDVRKRTTRYKVHKGDTLDQIARVYGVTVDRLADRNQMKKSQPIHPGLVLVIRWGPDLSRSVPYIYLDNAATSLPKPPGVGKAVADAILRAGNPVARATPSPSAPPRPVLRAGASRRAVRLRRQLPVRFHRKRHRPRLNQAIKGVLRAATTW